MKIIVIGAGGQARIVCEIASFDHNLEVVACIDNVVPQKDEKIMGIPVAGDHSVIPALIKDGVQGAVVAVGDNQIRAVHYDKLRKMGLEMVNVIHPTAYISPSATIGKGVTVCVGAIICTKTRIGNNVIINTGATVDHENVIEDHASIGPRCSTAGRVTIKKGAFIGIGSVIKEYLTVGENSVVGAGSVVLEDIPANVVAVGVPAKVIKTRDDK